MTTLEAQPHTNPLKDILLSDIKPPLREVTSPGQWDQICIWMAQAYQHELDIRYDIDRYNQHKLTSLELTNRYHLDPAHEGHLQLHNRLVTLTQASEAATKTLIAALHKRDVVDQLNTYTVSLYDASLLNRCLLMSSAQELTPADPEFVHFYLRSVLYGNLLIEASPSREHSTRPSYMLPSYYERRPTPVAPVDPEPFAGALSIQLLTMLTNPSHLHH